jgi:hypothetical protein
VDCNVKIHFTLRSLEYSIPAKDILHMPLFVKNAEPIPDPQPPLLEGRTEFSLRLNWKNLPFPAGIIDAVEIQYTKLFYLNPDDLQEINENEGEDTLELDYKWNTLVTKHYYRQNFYDYDFTSLSPGRCYAFRLKYHCLKGWSDYSPPSKVYYTLSSRPPPPPPPSCNTITSSAAELKWAFPQNTNGSKIIEFVLVGKAVGDEFAELYRGVNTSYLILGLYPEFAYSFKLAVVNAVGESDFSSQVSFQTPMQAIPRHVRKKYAEQLKMKEEKRKQRRNNQSTAVAGGRPVKIAEEEEEPLSEKPELIGFTEQQIDIAMSCYDAWNEFWDPKTEQSFYFNTILGFRQLKKPEVLVNTAPAAVNKNNNNNKNKTQAESNVMKPPKAVQNKLEQEKVTNEKEKAKEEEKINEIHLKSLETDVDFRTKRSRFLRALQQKKKTFIDAYVKSMTPQAPLSTRPASRASVVSSSAQSDNNSEDIHLFDQFIPVANSKNEFVKLDLHRETILYDFHQNIVNLLKTGQYSNVNVNLLKRFKVHFINEDGIDSGGLSKEAFLLISKDLFHYVKNPFRKWMVYTKGYSPAKKSTEDMKKMGKNDEKEEEEFIDGLFFAFDYLTNSKNTNQSEGANNTKISPYLEKEFLTPENVGSVLGALFGKAILDGHLIDFPLSSTLISYLLGKTPSYFLDPLLIFSTASTIPKEKLQLYSSNLLNELKSIDSELYKSLLWMKDNDITDIIDETFTVLIPSGNSTSSKDMVSIALCPNGENIPVTEENKLKYIYLVLLYKFKFSIQDFITSFLHVFHLMIPVDFMKEFSLSTQEFYLILNGKKTINIEELRAYCMYENVSQSQMEAYSANKKKKTGMLGDDDDDDDGIVIWNETNDIIIWLWRMIRETTTENKKLFIQFFTGTTCIPLDGFNPPITIVFGVDMVKNSLPKAHICFHQLVLPRYESYDIMKEKLFFAILNANNFGFS